MTIFPTEQYVCLNCGYNMVGFHPENCPFCGFSKKQFITAQDCSKKYAVKEFPVAEKVTRLNSVPDLGYEHAAYKIKTKEATVMIDCPSSFKERMIDPPTLITFTHHHFLGAMNLYQQNYSAKAQISIHDAKNKISHPFSFDNTFTGNFKIANEIEAFHVNGHTQGFTFYIFNECLFVCDYIFLRKDSMSFNPYGPRGSTLKGGEKIMEIIQNRKISKICGQNYVAEFDEWMPLFKELLEQ